MMERPTEEETGTGRRQKSGRQKEIDERTRRGNSGDTVVAYL